MQYVRGGSYAVNVPENDKLQLWGDDTVNFMGQFFELVVCSESNQI